MIYLDYAANTNVDKRVLKKYNEITLKYYANPNSTHSLGLKAKNKIEKSTEKVAQYFNTKKENIIYTSGATESNNLVITGLAESNTKNKRHIIISSIEHKSIIAPCNALIDKGYEITMIPLDKDGKVDLEILKKSIRKDTLLVSIIGVDSELGTIQPIEEIGKITKQHNVLFHTDLTQGIGKIKINYENIDFLTFAPHKFFGLNTIGVLINFNNVKLIPLIKGGKSTTIYRSGTPSPANVLSLEKALEIAMNNMEKRTKKVKKLKEYLINELLKIDDIHINTPKCSIPHILNFSIKNANDIVEKLNKKNIYVSTKSACSETQSMSNSVFSITKNKTYAKNSIRVSISHLTTIKELKKFIKVLKEIINENNKN